MLSSQQIANYLQYSLVCTGGPKIITAIEDFYYLVPSDIVESDLWFLSSVSRYITLINLILALPMGDYYLRSYCFNLS